MTETPDWTAQARQLLDRFGKLQSAPQRVIDLVAAALAAAYQQGRAREAVLVDLLRRIRGWDMLTPGATADAAFWRNEIDKLLAPAGTTEDGR